VRVKDSVPGATQDVSTSSITGKQKSMQARNMRATALRVPVFDPPKGGTSRGLKAAGAFDTKGRGLCDLAALGLQPRLLEPPMSSLRFSGGLGGLFVSMRGSATRRGTAGKLIRLVGEALDHRSKNVSCGGWVIRARSMSCMCSLM